MIWAAEAISPDGKWIAVQYSEGRPIPTSKICVSTGGGRIIHEYDALATGC